MVAVNPLLVLTVATLGLLLVVTVGILVLRDWNSYVPILTRGESEGSLSKFSESPVAWMLAFLLGTLALGGAAGYWIIAPEGTQGTLALVVAAVIGLLLAFFVFTGIWDAIRSQGRSNSEAVGIGAIVLGLLFVGFIAVQLLLA